MKWINKIHVPGRHSAAVRMEHIIHDERFWPIVVTLALLALLVAVAIWAGASGEQELQITPDRPFFPFTY